MVIHIPYVLSILTANSLAGDVILKKFQCGQGYEQYDISMSTRKQIVQIKRMNIGRQSAGMTSPQIKIVYLHKRDKASSQFSHGFCLCEAWTINSPQEDDIHIPLSQSFFLSDIKTKQERAFLTWFNSISFPHYSRSRLKGLCLVLISFPS